MNMQQAVVSVFSQYATFSGRAPRSEFWWYSLALYLAYIVLHIFDMIFLPGAIINSKIVFALATILPNLAVNTRRLHDIDKSGWNQLLYLIPYYSIVIIFSGISIQYISADGLSFVLLTLYFIAFISSCVLLYWYCQKGDVIDNDYGPNPLEAYED